MQNMARQWTAIERDFLAGAASSDTLFEAVDALFTSVKVFQDSQLYRIYRQIPLNGNSDYSAWNQHGEAGELLAAFRQALASSDREQAYQLSATLHSMFAQWLELNDEADRFSGIAYFRLLVVFLAFIALTAFAVLFLSKSLIRSLDREAENTEFSRAFILAQEEERERISRELHDTIAQDLRCLSLGMEKISRTSNSEEREKLCNEAAASQSALIHRVRDICDFLVPPDFRFQGLTDAIRRLCLDFGKRTRSEASSAGIDCRAEIMEGVKTDFLNREMQLQIFRIIQEALTNIEKHARATEAIVMMRGSDKGLYIGISDDGIGFTSSTPGLDTPHKQLGIRSMEKRAALLGGSLAIKSEKGEGTFVCLELPIPKTLETG